MKTAGRWNRIAFLVLAVTALGACGGANDNDDPQASAEAGDRESRSAQPADGPGTDSCPSDAEIVAVVGQPVQSKPWASGCFYEAADFTASVTIMRISPGQADQVEREMRESAAPYEAEFEAIDVGDRGHAWGSPGYGQGYAISGDRGWMVDVSVPSASDGGQRAQVIEILEKMIG